MTEKTFTELQYYAAARDDGWYFGDEDSAQDYCANNLTVGDIEEANVEHWRDEYNWWKAKP